MAAPQQDRTVRRPPGFTVQSRFRIVQLLRAVPIRWRILSIALLNSAVVIVLAVLIWNRSEERRVGKEC